MKKENAKNYPEQFEDYVISPFDEFLTLPQLAGRWRIEEERLLRWGASKKTDFLQFSVKTPAGILLPVKRSQIEKMIKGTKSDIEVPVNNSLLALEGAVVLNKKNLVVMVEEIREKEKEYDPRWCLSPKSSNKSEKIKEGDPREKEPEQEEPRLADNQDSSLVTGYSIKGLEAAARHVGVCEKTIRNYIKQIPHLLEDGAYHFKTTDLDHWSKEHEKNKCMILKSNFKK